MFCCAVPSVVVVPNVHAHLSPFSNRALSNHVFPSGSDTVSTSSCPITEAIASALTFPLGDATVWPAHEAICVTASPINANLTVVAAFTKLSWYPQKLGRLEFTKPLTTTFALVRTK